jgi:hypothetical protein
VLCELKVKCKDHSLIVVPVSAGRTVTGIVIADWYADAGAFPAEPSTLELQTRASSIRSLDFRNFSYQRDGVDTLVLRDGKEAGQVEGSRLLSVKYVDFDRDGNEEALITIANGRRSEGAYSEEYFVFTDQKGDVRQIFHQAREKSHGIRVSGQSIIITAPFWKPGDPGCCPRLIETATYSWRRGGFARTSRQLRPLRP